jgi:hypothetical protein
MSDHSRGAFRARPPSSARAAAYEIEIEAALRCAGTDTVTELSPEAAEVFRRHVSREVRRLELAGPGRAHEAAMRLRAYLAEPA